MATSGSKSIAVTSWNTLKFSWQENSQSVENNSTLVSWSLQLIAGSSGRIDSSAPKDWEVVINGEEYSGSNTVGVSNNTTKTLASGSTTIAHNTDGSKTFSYSFSQEFAITFDGSYIGTKSGSGSGTLDTIPRASQPSCITWPEHTQNVGEFGDTISIHMNRKSSAFTHTVRYKFGAMSGTIATGVTNGTTWTIPASLMNLLPNVLSGSGTIYVDTYNGSTLIGTKYCGFTATVPADIIPGCSIQVLDATDINDAYGNLVKGMSKLYIKTTGTPAYSSPIASYSVNANGGRYTAAEVTTGVLAAAGTTTITATVKDKRGRTSAQAEASFTVLDYHPPAVSALAVHRCDEDGTDNAQGEFVRATFSAEITALNNKNTAAYTLRYKQSTASNYTEVSFAELEDVYTVAGHDYIFAADSNSSYDVEVEAKDNHSTTTRATSASTAFTLINWGAEGDNMALGKVAERNHAFEVALNNYFYGSTIQTGNRYCFSTPGVASQAGYILMARIVVTAANADTPITFVFSRRQATAPMTVHVSLRNSTATASSLSGFKYEGDNYGAFLIQEDDLTWALYVQKVSAYDTITLQDWWCSKTMEDRVVVTFSGTLVSELPGEWYRATPLVPRHILDSFFPVGFILFLYSHADPNTMYPGTTWVRIENTFLWACDEDGEIGVTGGEKTHTLTVNELPAHSHGGTYTNAGTARTHSWLASGGSSMGYDTIETGGGQAHNNMPPYIHVSVWRRTA